jgi:hypothetical protein
MLNNLSEQVRECLEHAQDCARVAAEQTCAKRKEEFLDLERRWLSLARSHEFTERLDDFCGENRRRSGDLPKTARGK